VDKNVRKQKECEKGEGKTGFESVGGWECNKIVSTIRSKRKGVQEWCITSIDWYDSK
jgi:hypothetical protein